LTGHALTQVMQWSFHHFVMYDRPELSSFVDWVVIAAAILLIILSIITNYRLVKRLLYRMF
jgi:hypothetical protein